jgi:hypothetical protein
LRCFGWESQKLNKNCGKANKNHGKANKSRGKANKSHGNWIWRSEGQLIGVTYKTFYILYEPIHSGGQMTS